MVDKALSYHGETTVSTHDHLGIGNSETVNTKTRAESNLTLQRQAMVDD